MVFLLLLTQRLIAGKTGEEVGGDGGGELPGIYMSRGRGDWGRQRVTQCSQGLILEHQRRAPLSGESPEAGTEEAGKVIPVMGIQ